ncbi:hypothetical protein BLOT_003079 [Blomia tropicalis]|nr:hypothetical protein BLOT_003079 [Blomia tropicalis]
MKFKMSKKYLKIEIQSTQMGQMMDDKKVGKKFNASIMFHYLAMIIANSQLPMRESERKKHCQSQSVKQLETV